MIFNRRRLRILISTALVLVFSHPLSASASSTWGSIYFDGTQYLSSTNMSAVGTGNFTYEFWFYSTADSSSNQVMMNTRQSVTVGQDQDGIDILVTPGRGLFVSYKMLAFANTADGTLSKNRWYHVAVVRSGNTIYTYLDGVQVASTAMQGTNLYSQRIWLGSTAGGTFKFTGYISNFRYTKSDLYSANFTPPTDEYAAVANTSILLNTRSDSTFADNSVAGTTFTNNGGSSFSTENPFLRVQTQQQRDDENREIQRKAAAERAAAIKSAREKLNAALVANTAITVKDMSDADAPLKSVESLLAAYQELIAFRRSVTTPLSAEDVAQKKFNTIMKYAMIERITGVSSGEVFGRDLVRYGVIDQATPMKQLATYRLFKLPLSQRDTVDEISAYFAKSSKDFLARKSHLAQLIAKYR